MTRHATKGGEGWILPVAFGVLIVVLFILGQRTQEVAAVVLDRGGSEAVLERGGPPPALFSDLALRDSLRAGSGPGSRNPFLFEVSRPIRQATGPQADPVEEVQPTLGALLFDSIDPTIQLKLGSTTSPWLRTGDQFQGWAVVSIGQRSVVIEKQGDRRVLP